MFFLNFPVRKVPSGTDWYQCSTLQDFLITYKETDAASTEQIRVPLTNSTTTVKKLKPCTSYSFQIQATNLNKEGVLSPAQFASTDFVGEYCNCTKAK